LLSGALSYTGQDLIPDLLKFLPVILRDFSWGPRSSMYLLNTYVMQLPTLIIYSLMKISKPTEPLSILRTAIY
jgi:hypothetical protein